MTDFAAEMFDIGPAFLQDKLVCGVVGKDDEIYQDFVVSPLNGRGENYLRASGETLALLNKVLCESLVSIGPVEDKEQLARFVTGLSTVDRLIALIAVRRATHGDIYQMTVPLPDDHHKFEYPDGTKRYKVDLTTLDRTYMEDPEKRRRDDLIELAHRDDPEKAAKFQIEWHVMNGADEQWLDKVRPALKGVASSSLELLCRLDAVTRTDTQEAKRAEVKRGRYDEKARRLNEQLKQSLALIDAMPSKLLQGIRNLFDRYEGDVDLSLDFEYLDADRETRMFKGAMDPRQREFFFPREASNS